MKRSFLAAFIGVLALLNTASAQAQGKKYPKAEWVDPIRTEPNGTKYRTFQSKVLKGEVSYLIYLPPDYDKETKRYPVIYWLHGLGGNQRGGAMMFVPLVDKAIRDGALPPTIVVSVNGMVRSWYCDWVDGKLPIESVITKDLIAHVDETYRTVAQREGRAIQGYSMGGFGAGHLGFKYPELFGTVVVDAGALVGELAWNGPNLAETFKEAFAGDKERFFAEHPFRLAKLNADKLRKSNIRIGCGKEDNLLSKNQELHTILDELKIEHQYEVVPDIDHNGGAYYRKLGNKGFEVHRKAFEALSR